VTATVISAQQLAVFRRYGGDYDGLALMGTPDERELMVGGVWHRIDALLTQVVQLQAGLTAEEYSARIRQNISDEIPDASAQAAFFELAATEP
jgi:hypothetical protein